MKLLFIGNGVIGSNLAHALTKKTRYYFFS